MQATAPQTIAQALCCAEFCRTDATLTMCVHLSDTDKLVSSYCDMHAKHRAAQLLHLFDFDLFRVTS